MSTCSHPDCATVLSRYNAGDRCGVHAGWEPPPTQPELSPDLQAEIDARDAEYEAWVEEHRQWLAAHPAPPCERCTDPVEAEPVIHWPGVVLYHRECYTELVAERLARHGRAMTGGVQGGVVACSGG